MIGGWAKAQRDVSIHAPYIGSDAGREAHERNFRGFNPRSLHRERRHRGGRLPRSHRFNPRSLHRERRDKGSSRALADSFNPRSLHRERHRRILLRDLDLGFNPRSLHRERPSKRSGTMSGKKFQSTLPT